MVPFSILDLAPVAEGYSVADSLVMSRRMAVAAEEHGYARFWLAEHHGMAAVASSATSVVLSHIGAATSTIRIGSGGVMLPNHSPLVIAEQFGTLAELYPGRVDLGLGRAPGTDMQTARALRRNMNASVDSYPDDILELQRLLGHGDQGVMAVPGHNTHVPLWLLGSSLYSAQVAAEFGLPYSFASHFAPDQLIQALSVYRRNFKASEQLAKLHSMAGIMAVVADTDEEANYLFTSAQQQFVNLRRDRNLPFSTPVESMEGIWSPSEKHMVEHMLQYAIVGSKETVAFQLASFLELTKVDELIVSMPIHDPEARLTSLRLMAEVRDSL
ncbi:LLM class flavin-dependent oxidoreductase [Marinomonas sp. M1K-6]|uniref:Luciferase-like monooxygenase n=1 Tax=Marinomonas profundi TaxID=2726122 RepID=A0A847QVV5_9GAMM|nr:LLM class flavin-dependent oxidoreductase [Marinomonas profundi]NLQ16019.1 LLM class flavin-dependent oxidoreductase [Marinomonas profundi]UDV03387.1 LLM class flavin-dependent oxidoreductase [Marinomonas profundi]